MPQIQPVIPLTEDKIRKYFRQLISAIEYCHETARVIHRDIKPENLLIDDEDNVKLSDFGVSFIMENGTDEIQTSAGSYYYTSPEACLGSMYKGKKSDIWACGVTLYFMIFKQHPFEDNVIPSLFKKIQTEEPSYKPIKGYNPIFEVSPQLRDLLAQILTKNPESRISISEIKEHPWITQSGLDPMPLYLRMLIQLTDEDRHNAISKVNFFGKVLLQKIGLSPLLKATNRGGAGGGQKQAPPPSSMSLLSNLIAGINKAKEKQNNNQA